MAKTPVNHPSPPTSVPRLDRIDMEILSALQDDGRLTIRELAQRVHLTPTPCFERVKKLEKAQVIDKYVAVVNPTMLGYHTNVFISVRLSSQSQSNIETFVDHINSMSEVQDCFLMTGKADFLLRILVTDIAALENVLVHHIARIPGVTTIESSVALKHLKRSTAVALF